VPGLDLRTDPQQPAQPNDAGLDARLDGAEWHAEVVGDLDMGSPS
jgi:hypothetical protein